MTRFSLSAMKTLSITLVAALALVGCGDLDPTTGGAREALKKRGLKAGEVFKTQSERTLSACGRTTTGARFVYRSDIGDEVTVEGTLSPDAFELLWASWCKPLSP